MTNNTRKGHQGFYRTHGMRDAAEYRIWNHMKLRCHSPTNTSYYKYGARGITVCRRWRDSFEAFYADMGPRPSRKHTLDRIDNNGPYSPENCRWADLKTQARNKRSNILVTANGETLCISAWAERLGVHRSVLAARKDMGWSDDDIVNRPIAKAGDPIMVEWNGETRRLSDLAREMGFDLVLVRARVKNGMPVAEAISTPKKEVVPVKKLAAEYGMSETLLRLRLNRGWDLQRALTQPLGPQHGRWGSKRNGTRVHPST